MVTNNENKFLQFPYVPYPAFKTFIGHLHDTVVTDQIDNSMMPPKMSGAVRSAVTSGLKALGFIDGDNNTTEKLKEVVAAYGSKEWPGIIEKHILSTYQSVTKGIELKSATRKQLDKIFEGASPQMRDKYIRFFLSANKEAGVEYSPHLKIRRRLTKKRPDTATQKGRTSSKERNKPKGEEAKYEKPSSDIFELPIPIAPGSCIRVPSNIAVNQVALVKAAIGYIEAMAQQNEESKE